MNEGNLGYHATLVAVCQRPQDDGELTNQISRKETIAKAFEVLSCNNKIYKRMVTVDAFYRPTSEGFQIADEKGTAEVLGVSALNLIIVRCSSSGDCVLECGI